MNDQALSDQVADPAPGRDASPSWAVTVRYWAGAKAATGVAEERLSGPSHPAGDPPATVAGVVTAAVARHPQAEPVLGVCAVLVDGVSSGPEAPVAPGAVIEFLPPFAGG